MKLSELKNELDSINLPVAYNHFEEVTPLPYIVYFIDESSNFYADNIVYLNFCSVRIELYTKLKNQEYEDEIEKILNGLEIPYETLETYIDSENCYQVVYFIEINLEKESE